MKVLILHFFILTLPFTLFTSVKAESKRPVYLIGHRINSVEYIKKALQSGCNAMEIDVRYGRFFFGSKGWYVDHDGVYPWSTTLEEWLEEASLQADNYYDRFSMIIIDIKTPTQLSGLRNCVRNKLPSDLPIIYSIGDFDDRYAFDAITNDLRDNEGLAIDFGADPIDVQDFFISRSVNNYWYGNGICAACIEGSEIESSIREAIALRDDNIYDIKGVYTWSYANYNRIYDYLIDIGVNGIMVNGINFLTIGDGVVDGVEIINNDSSIRFATRDDNPFGFRNLLNLN